MFQKKKIGTLSRSDKAEIERIREIYDRLCLTLNDIKLTLEEILCNFENVDLDLIKAFLKSDPEDFVKRKFVEFKGIGLSGISKEALIGSDLLDLPKEPFDYLMSDINKYKTLQASVEKFSNFRIDIQSLYVTEDDHTLFSLTAEFDTALEEFYSNYTENEIENEQLEAIEKFVDSVNGLMKLGLIRKDHRWLNDIKFQPSSYDIDPSSDNPLTLNRRFFFHRRRFGKGTGLSVS